MLIAFENQRKSIVKKRLPGFQVPLPRIVRIRSRHEQLLSYCSSAFSNLAEVRISLAEDLRYPGSKALVGSHRNSGLYFLIHFSAFLRNHPGRETDSGWDGLCSSSSGILLQTHRLLLLREDYEER